MGNNTRNLMEHYLCLIHGRDSIRFRLLMSAMESHRVLFFFDCDEGGSLHTEVSNYTCHLMAQHHRVILTCRYDCIRESNIIKLPHLCTVLELQQLNEGQQKSIIHARLGTEGAKPFMYFLDIFDKKVKEQGADGSGRGDEHGGL